MSDLPMYECQKCGHRLGRLVLPVGDQVRLAITVILAEPPPALLIPDGEWVREEDDVWRRSPNPVRPRLNYYIALPARLECDRCRTGQTVQDRPAEIR